MTTNNETKGCTPYCSYFPMCETVVAWEYDENGLKRRVDKKEFLCGYDGHVIKDWNSPCPRETQEN